MNLIKVNAWQEKKAIFNIYVYIHYSSIGGMLYEIIRVFKNVKT